MLYMWQRVELGKGHLRQWVHSVFYTVPIQWDPYNTDTLWNKKSGLIIRVSIFQGEVFIGTMGQINCGDIKLIIEMSTFQVCLLCTYVASITVLRGPQEGPTWWSSTVPAKISGQVSVVKYFC